MFMEIFERIITLLKNFGIMIFVWNVLVHGWPGATPQYRTSFAPLSPLAHGVNMHEPDIWCLVPDNLQVGQVWIMRDPEYGGKLRSFQVIAMTEKTVSVQDNHRAEGLGDRVEMLELARLIDHGLCFVELADVAPIRLEHKRS